MSIFQTASILLPGLAHMDHWPVVACDQFSSQPDYWKRVAEKVKDRPSSLHLILPEAWLNTEKEQSHQQNIPSVMHKYLDEGILEEFPNAFIYVERELSNHKIRRGLVGALDLEAYSYTGEDLPIRATEKTILERIPPRVAIREAAPLEVPHVLLLADDESDLLLQPISDAKDSFMVLYDLDLMEEGGHLTGWLVSDEHAKAFYERLGEFEEVLKERYGDLAETRLQFAVGDGNHSLAAAKALWEQIKPTLTPEQALHHPARYALAELENIHDASQEFEPIHRLLQNVSDTDVLYCLRKYAGAREGYPVRYYAEHDSGIIYLDPAKGEMPVAILQAFLDDYLEEHPEASIDYIHESRALKDLTNAPKTIGFVLPPVSKSSLFRQVIQSGSLPRKTFSMGHANEKRYYMEARKIQPDKAFADAASFESLMQAEAGPSE